MQREKEIDGCFLFVCDEFQSSAVQMKLLDSKKKNVLITYELSNCEKFFAKSNEHLSPAHQNHDDD